MSLIHSENIYLSVFYFSMHNTSVFIKLGQSFGQGQYIKMSNRVFFRMFFFCKEVGWWGQFLRVGERVSKGKHSWAIISLSIAISAGIVVCSQNSG